MPAGPWDDEPDKIIWIDGATNLDCMILRNSMGALCGYVGVGPEHPWHGKDYGHKLPEPDCEVCQEDPEFGCYTHTISGKIDVHGGLTFSSGCREDERGPAYGICHVPQVGRAMSQQCALCGAFLPKPRPGERFACSRCGVEFDNPTADQVSRPCRPFVGPR